MSECRVMPHEMCCSGIIYRFGFAIRLLSATGFVLPLPMSVPRKMSDTRKAAGK